MIGYFKNEKVIQSQEFQVLAGELQRALTAETKPHIEIVSVRTSLLLESGHIITESAIFAVA